MLRTELQSKSTEGSQLQERLSQLTAELGGRDNQLNQLQLECDRLTADNEAAQYDLNKVINNFDFNNSYYIYLIY